MKVLTTRQQITIDRFIVFGLLAASFAGLVTLAQRETLTEPLKVAAYFFAASIPLLSLIAYVATVDSYSKYTVDPPFVSLLGLIGICASVAGVASIFLHFSLSTALVFIGCSIVGFIASNHFDGLYAKVQEAGAEEAKAQEAKAQEAKAQEAKAQEAKAQEPKPQEALFDPVLNPKAPRNDA